MSYNDTRKLGGCMNQRYLDKIETISNYYETLKREFKWETDLGKHLVALNYVVHDRPLNTENIKSFSKVIKGKTGMFSPFRGTMQFAISGLLTSEYDQPEIQLVKMLEQEDTLKNVGFKQATYLPTALYALARCESDMSSNQLVERAKVIYDEMKRNHPFLTSGDDYALAILLANTSRNPEILERYYNALNSEGFSKTNGLQMLSHILSFNDKDVLTTVKRCVEIRDILKKNKLNVSSEYYPAIGLMALLEDEDGEILHDLVEASNYLKGQKGYKWLGKGMNVMIVAALIASEYVKDIEEGVMTTTLQVSVQSIIAAQQAAMIAAVGTTAAVAASS